MNWIWLVVGISVVIFILDWLIVLGKNPKYWKGGDKDE